MKALWLELGDSEITAIPIHFMTWSDKFATARRIKPKRESRVLRRHVIRFLDHDAIADRRHQIEEFVSVAAPANRFYFSFLEPSPPSDLFIHGDLDRVAPLQEVIEQIDELKPYKEPSSRIPSCPGPTTSSRTGSSR
jgi:hypothetical protein